jgi:hypothetical protein
MLNKIEKFFLETINNQQKYSSNDDENDNEYI